MDGGLAAEEVKLAVFLQHFVVPSKAAAGQHHGLTVDMDFAAGILGNHAGDRAGFIGENLLGRAFRPQLNAILGELAHHGFNQEAAALLNGVEHGVLHVGAAPAGTNGIVAT